MGPFRKTAIVVGVLFIIATVSAILIIVALGSTLDPPDYLTNVAANENGVAMAVICELILAVSVMGIGFVIFPLLKKQNEALALGYVTFRITEAILIIIASISLLSLMTLSEEFVAGSLNADYYEASGASLLALRDWAFLVGTLIFLGLGGLILNYLLYQSKLVPRWLSLWGLIGAALVLIYGLLTLFELDPSFLAAPVAIEEMVFAVWIIVKGFDLTALAPGL